MPQPVARRDIPASLLRPPRLVGRAREQAALAAAWSGQRAFWLLGEAGLGKTRLISEFAAEASAGQAAAQVLLVSARPGDAGVPYASLGRALRAVIERVPAVLEPAQRAELARVLPEIGHAIVAAAGATRRPTLFAALEALLLDAHADGLAALVIDDLHFADSASLEMLQGLVLAERLADLRWGFAQRPAEGEAAVEALATALEEAHRVEFVALGALDEAAMRELVESLGLASPDPARLAPLLVRHTGGNPLYALETLKHLIATGATSLDEGLPRPPSIRHLIERRLRQLSPAAIALARIAAIAGVDFSIELAEQVLATRALALADPWRELEEAQVLRDRAFAHDLVLEATLAGVPAPIAAHAHQAIAEFLEARGHAPARVASHWIASGQPQRARAALHAAADAARQAMRRKEEAGFLSRVAEIEAESGDAAQFESLRTMIDALWNADRGGIDATTYERLAAAATTAQQRGVVLGMRAIWVHEQGDVEGAKRLCRQAIELGEAAGDDAGVAQAREQLALFLHFSGECDAAVALLQQLQPWISEHATDARKVDFYGDLGIVLDNADRGREARTYHKLSIDLARRIGAWSEVVTVLANLAISWATAGYMARSIELLHEALRLAAAHDEARGCGSSLPIELHNGLRDCGRYADALNWIEPALAAADGQLAAWKPLVRCQVACTWIHLGQHARAQHEIDAALAAEAPDWMRAKALQMRARMRLGLGRGTRELHRRGARPGGPGRAKVAARLDRPGPRSGARSGRGAGDGARGDRRWRSPRPARHRARRTHSGDALRRRRGTNRRRGVPRPRQRRGRRRDRSQRPLPGRALAQRLAGLAARRARRGGRGGAGPGRGVDSRDDACPGARGVPRQLHARQPRQPATPARCGPDRARCGAAMSRRGLGALLAALPLLVFATGAMAQWLPSGALAKVPVVRDCDETGGDVAVSRLDPPTIYLCPRVVDLVRKKDPGAEQFYLVHEYGHIALATSSEAEADCWAARELAKARNGERYLNAAIRHFERRPDEPSTRYGSPGQRAQRIRDCAEM